MRRAGYTERVDTHVTWDDIAAEAPAVTEMIEEMMATTDQTPAELRARARELRAQADATDINGCRSAYVMLAARYEETAAARETAA